MLRRPRSQRTADLPCCPRSGRAARRVDAASTGVDIPGSRASCVCLHAVGQRRRARDACRGTRPAPLRRRVQGPQGRSRRTAGVRPRRAYSGLRTPGANCSPLNTNGQMCDAILPPDVLTWVVGQGATHGAGSGCLDPGRSAGSACGKRSRNRTSLRCRSLSLARWLVTPAARAVIGVIVSVRRRQCSADRNAKPSPLWGD